MSVSEGRAWHISKLCSWSFFILNHDSSGMQSLWKISWKIAAMYNSNFYLHSCWMQMRLYPSPLIALGILHQVEIFLHEIGVDEFQPDLLLMAFVFRVVGSSMAESSRCFQNCSRNSVCRLIPVTGLYPL
jgi:hypothetical protein